MPSVSLRLFNAYGPGHDPASPYAGVIAKFFSNVLNDLPHTIQGDGSQVRDFVHVQDVVSAILHAGDLAASRPGAHRFNVCTGAGTTVAELAQKVDAASGRARTAAYVSAKRSVIPEMKERISSSESPRATRWASRPDLTWTRGWRIFGAG